MKRGALITLIFFFSVFDLFPQVIIKESVEIKPEKYFSNSTSDEHTIIFNLQWDNPGAQATVVGISIPCQSARADWQYGGNISLTVDNARAGLYWFQSAVNQDPYDTTRFYYQLYFDGVIIRNDSTVLIGGFNSGSYPYFNVQYTPPLVSDYSFNLVSNELCYKKFGELGISTSNNCATGVSWNSSTNLNLTITSGQEFASFYHYDFSSYFPTIELLGDNIEVTLAELEDISLEQDSLFNGSNVKVNVQAEWGAIIKIDSATAYPASEYVVSAESYGVEEINTGDEVFMELNVLSDLNCGFCLPLYETYNAQIIKGGEYGSLVDPVTGESVQSLTGIEQYTFGPGQPCGVADLDYIADGVSTDVEDSVIIRISTSDPQIQPTDKLFLIKPSPVYVTITPDTLAPGDTASIIIKKRNPDGTIEDFPDDQFLEVGMLTGCLSGIILDCYDDTCYQDTYFSDVLPTDSVYFVADSSADSGTVKIRVGIVDDGGGISAGIAAPTNRTGLKKIGKEKHKLSVKKNRSVEEKAVFIKDVKSRINNSALLVSEKQKMIEKLNTLASPKAQSSECYIGDYIGVTPANKNIVVNSKPELVILSPTKDSSPDTITAEPKMPNVVCKAQLNGYNSGVVKYEWEYSITYELKRVNLCSRAGTITFGGTSYSENSNVSIWSVPFKKDSIKKIALVGKLYTTGCEDTSKTWDEGENVFIVGKINIKVTAYDEEGKKIATQEVEPGKLIGSNPGITSIKSYNSDHIIWAIIQQESSWLQFETNHTATSEYNVEGMPRYGPPSGFGLMQLDNKPYASELDLCNWKQNIDDGANRFSMALTNARNYLERFGQTNIPNEILYHEALQNYNGKNKYYTYDKESGWVRLPWLWKGNPKTKKKEIISNYADKVYSIYVGFGN